VEDILRYWPKADLRREPDPEPFEDFPELELDGADQNLDFGKQEETK